jgi:hypothetical protein
MLVNEQNLETGRYLRLKDMTEVRKFESGAIRDLDDTKEDYVETFSWTALKRHAVYMTGKKKRYGAGNFKKGIPIESYEQSLVRHLQKYMENKYEQGICETEDDHLAAMLFNICGIMHEEERLKKVKNEKTTKS